jgi:hypothetical protein
MRKVMLLAAMLAMALAAAAPAFGQVGAVNQESNQFGVVDDSVCSQVYNIAVQQYNAGDQTAAAGAIAAAGATAGPFGTAAAAAIAGANAVNIANAADINVNTVNVCLNNFTTVTPTATHTAKTVTPKATVYPKKTVTPKATVYPKKYYYKDGKKYYATASATATAYSGGGDGGGGGYTLPETGGASLLALGAGALLVGGGLLARRIAR